MPHIDSESRAKDELMLKNKQLETELIKNAKLLKEKDDEIIKLKKLNLNRNGLLVEQVSEVQQLVDERDSQIITLGEENKAMRRRMQEIQKSFVEFKQISFYHTFVNIPVLISIRSVFSVVGPGLSQNCDKEIWGYGLSH